MPPPQPLKVVSPDTVVVKPSLTRVPVGFPPVPVQYVPNAPISNSFGLKYSGGGGLGAITSFEDTTGSPAKATTACDARATTAKAVNFFIESFPLSTDGTRWVRSLHASTGVGIGTRSRIQCGERINPDRKFLLDLSPISDTARGGPELNSNG